MDKLLPSLYDSELLTNIECRIIVSSEDIDRRTAAINEILKYKTSNEIDVITEVCNEVAIPIQNLRKSTDEERNSSLNVATYEKNPLLIDVVANNVLKFLTLNDIKMFRIVCREWNAAAALSMRKRSVFRLKSNILRPSTYVDVCKYSNVPASAFRVCYSFAASDLEQFFNKCGNHIEYIDFHKCTLFQNKLSGKKRLQTYDVTSWFLNTTKLLDLKFNSSIDAKDTVMEISFEKLLPLQTITLIGLGGFVVKLPITIENTRMKPLNICLLKIIFKRNDEFEVDEVHFNDIVDFGQAENIALVGYRHVLSSFDMARQCFNAKYVLFKDVTLENWKQATGSIDFLELHSHPFVEKNNLCIKQLLHKERTIDFSALPETIEKLGLYDCYDFSSSQPNPLPNLKYLTSNTLCPFINVLPLLSTCVHLQNLQIFQCQPFRDWRLQTDLLPKTIKHLKINGLNFYFHNEDITLELDTLVLENTNKWTSVDQVAAVKSALTKIKPKTLVIVWCNHQFWDLNEILGEVILVHTEIERILIGTRSSKYMECDLHRYDSFETSTIKQYVDKKSNYYHFEKSVGKAITREEFSNWKKMNGLNLENVFGLQRNFI